MRPVAAILTLFTVVLLHIAQDVHAAPAYDELTLVLPHPLRANETAVIAVRLGVIGPGQEINVAFMSGATLGVISPYGIHYGQPAGTYTLPVPANAIRIDRISIRLTISGAGSAPRAPTAEEVLGVTLTAH
jgi:hypothetical protein